MTKNDGEKIGIAEDQCRFHIRIDRPRSSMAPPAKATWIKLHNVGLDNFGPDGEEEDRVQVAIPWKWPDPFADLSTETLREVQRRTPERPRRLDPRSPDWIGYLIIDVLRLDRDSKAAKHKAKEIFETWRKSHYHRFKIVDGKDNKGNPRGLRGSGRYSMSCAAIEKQLPRFLSSTGGRPRRWGFPSLPTPLL
jgi:hypothetical protein